MSNVRQNNQPVKLNEFLARHAVFTVAELDRYLAARGSSNPHTRKALLAYHRARGRIVPLRRGLYAAVPLGAGPGTSPIDPFLVAAQMTPDAVLGYHTALEFHGKAYSTYTRLHYLSGSKSLPLKLQTYEIRRVPAPKALQEKGKEMFGVQHRHRSGVEIRVTSLERTLVDILDRPDLIGSWEEIWRSLESVEFFDLDQVVEYASLLGNATTAAKTGFFLDQHREALMVDGDHLDELRKMRPRQPHYLARGRRGESRWVKEWNLMVPDEILARSWGEVL
jgi:predicted transcriptional regulator of viral defense system